jgi:hypothetical protein
MGKKANAIVPASPDLLAPILAQFEAAPTDEDALFTTRDNMSGTTPVVPQIKISKDGAFLFPGDEIVKQFDGVIMHKHRGRAWWKNAQITNSPPDCFSMDGNFCEANLAGCPIPEDVRQENMARYGTPWVCATCPKGQWGTGFKADGTPSRSKACKEAYRLFVLATDPTVASAVPYKLMAPPTSLKSVDEFFTALTGKGIGYRTMLVTFSLRKAQSADGFPYAELVLTPHPDRKLTDRDREAFKQLHKQFSGGFEEKAAADFVEGGPAAPKAEMPGSGAKTKSKFL